MRRTYAVAACCLLATGCGGSVSTPRVPEQDLAASTTQCRNQEGTRALRTGLTNNSTHSIEVGTATFVWPGFAWPDVHVDQTVPAGQTAAFDMTYGDARCDHRPPRKASMEVEVNGSRRTLPMQVQDAGLLIRLWRQQCALRSLAGAASVRLLPGHLDGPRYLSSIALTRRSGDAPVRIVDVGGSVIIDMLAPPRPRVLTGSARSLRLPITFRPSDRCDPHSLSQSQQTFLLSAYLRVGNAPVVRLILPLSHRVHAELQHMIDRYCT